MATTVTLTQPLAAILNQPCHFTLGIGNANAAGGANITLSAANLQVTNPNGGVVGQCCRISDVQVPPQLGSPQPGPGGTQLNILLTPGQTQYLDIEATFFGPSYMGVPTQPAMQFLVQAFATTTDGTFGSQPIELALNQPVFGPLLSQGPPNPVPTLISTQFFSPFNSQLIL